MPYNPANNPLNGPEWVFPLLEVVHISCFSMSVGLISLVNLRLGRLAFKEMAPQELDRKLFLWTIAGLTIVLTSGMLLFTTDPLRYYYNPGFRFKMAALIVAIVYQYTVQRVVIRSSPDTSLFAPTSAILSTILWVSVVFGGIFYAFV
jgi:hypothetical protein